MKKIEEYFQHAAECRGMARTASPAHRQQLEQMAETWDQLAKARKHVLEKIVDSEGLVIKIPPQKSNGAKRTP